MGHFDDSTGLEVLDRDECLRLLGAHYLGRVAFTVGGHVEILPVNYALVAGAVVLRTAHDSLLATHVPGHEVAFEIDHADAMTHTGWSVVVRGPGEAVDDPGERASLARVPLRPWGAGRRDLWVRIRPRSISGRRVVHRGGRL